ncbi:transcription factor IIIA-like [Acanthaster planci]|uniref:Transcription factor IIIA-like n=1 Tax=Acanthaster planci TaxID=133434 RepID=A0A8B7YE62_ACAPL|nr:transcription factor IIIA-like [Acanthaster planci]
MKSHEKIKEVFICPRENCNRSYLKPSYLELHIKNYHDGGRPYACDHPGCSKTFIHKCSLSKHQVVHEPDYVRPPPKPRKKRGLASRLSGYPDEASRLPHPKIETNTFNRACEVPGGVTSVEAAEEMDSTAQESEDVLDAAPTVTMETSGSDAGDREGKAEVREMEDDGYRGSVHL